MIIDPCNRRSLLNVSRLYVQQLAAAYEYSWIISCQFSQLYFVLSRLCQSPMSILWFIGHVDHGVVQIVFVKILNLPKTKAKLLFYFGSNMRCRHTLLACSKPKCHVEIVYLLTVKSFKSVNFYFCKTQGFSELIFLHEVKSKLFIFLLAICI